MESKRRSSFNYCRLLQTTVDYGEHWCSEHTHSKFNWKYSLSKFTKRTVITKFNREYGEGCVHSVQIVCVCFKLCLLLNYACVLFFEIKRIRLRKWQTLVRTKRRLILDGEYQRSYVEDSCMISLDSIGTHWVDSLIQVMNLYLYN